MPLPRSAARLAATVLAALALALPPSAQEAQEAPRRGGAIVVAFETESATLDPAHAATPRDQTLVRALHDGLLAPAPDGGVEPALALSHAASPDRLRHRFTLREGVAFHSGRALKAQDVVFTLNRLADPETASPAAPLFSAIEGYAAVAAGEAEALVGVTAPDDRTVEIALARPDARLPATLASSWASVVNPEAVMLHSLDFGRNPDGTGPYRLQAWRAGEGLTLQRDFDHWRDGAPLLDQVRVEFGQSPETALERLGRGEVDVLGDGAPQRRAAEIIANPAAERVARGPVTATGFLAMNMSRPPFDDARARRAVGLAIDRGRIAAMFGGAAEPASGFGDAAAPGAAPDRDAARALLAEAGLGAGAEVALVSTDAEAARPVARAIQADLAAVGLTATLREVPEGALSAAAERADLVWTGAEAQPVDAGDPSALYAATLACDGRRNWSRFCDPALDARARAADAAEGAPRDAAWRAVLADALAQAPVAPLLLHRRVTVLSDRVGGAERDLAPPLHQPLDYGRVWSRDVQ